MDSHVIVYRFIYMFPIVTWEIISWNNLNRDRLSIATVKSQTYFYFIFFNNNITVIQYSINFMYSHLHIFEINFICEREIN